MRKKYIRKAWLIDDGILVAGHVCKRVFYPDKPCSCGFSCQKIRRRDIGIILFYDRGKALVRLRIIPDSWLSKEHTYAYR